MNLENNELHISIAGFVFRFIFKVKDKSNIGTKEYVKYVLSYFSPFILQKKTEKVDYSIELLEQVGTEGIQKKQSMKIKNDVFIKLYSEDKKRKKITAFSRIILYNLELFMKLILYDLLRKNKSFCIHSSAALSSKETAYLFLGESGAGKSTVLKLLKKRMTPIYDDAGFIKKEKNAYYLYVTHFQEKNQYQKDNSRFTIGKIFIIKKSSHFRIEKVPDSDLSLMIETTTSQMLVNKNKRDIFDFIAKHKTDFYYLYFSNKDGNLAEKLLSYDFNHYKKID